MCVSYCIENNSMVGRQVFFYASRDGVCTQFSLDKKIAIGKIGDRQRKPCVVELFRPRKRVSGKGRNIMIHAPYCLSYLDRRSALKPLVISHVHVKHVLLYTRMHTQSGHSWKLHKNRCLTTVRQNSFANSVVEPWNNLPMSVVTAESQNVFKSRLNSVQWSSRKFDPSC
jgi:hypothetical protein